MLQKPVKLSENVAYSLVLLGWGFCAVLGLFCFFFK